MNTLRLTNVHRAWLVQIGQHLLSLSLQLCKPCKLCRTFGDLFGDLYKDLQSMQLLDKCVQHTEACKRLPQMRGTWEREKGRDVLSPSRAQVQRLWH